LPAVLKSPLLCPNNPLTAKNNAIVRSDNFLMALPLSVAKTELTEEFIFTKLELKSQVR
jgi:hypothetical protein